MKNWIIFISIFLISLAIVISSIVLIQARAPYKNAEQLAEETAIDEGHLAAVTNSYVYRGLSSNMTVIGEDGKGNKKAVFIYEKDSEKEPSVLSFKDGISGSEATKLVEKELDVKELLHVRLGMEEVGPVWEVSFIGKNDKLNYVYILFENGNWWKRILNL